MSRLYRMTWEKARSRWRKMYKGKVYTVTPETLGVPATKDSSYQAANAWWEAKLNEFENQPNTRFDTYIRQLEEAKAAEEFLPEGYDPIIASIRSMAKDDTVTEEDVKPLVTVSSSDLMFGVMLNKISKKPVTSKDLTIGLWIDNFLALRMDEVNGKELSVSQFDVIRLCLDNFKKWVGDDSTILKINPELWVRWYRHLLNWDISTEYKKKNLVNVRNFASWLVEQGLIPPFESLFARRYKFANDKKEVQPLAKNKVKEIIEKSKGRLRLALLLMVNTGMTQIDISNLRRAEYIDGRIERSRSKTIKQNTRTVSWKLWESTRRLLDQYAEKTGDRLFLTESGKPWIRDFLKDGKRSKTDALNSSFRHLECGVTLKQFRQTAGDMIEKNFDKGLADHFLGHGQKPVDAAYFSREQERLDVAVDWLKDQFGLASISLDQEFS